MTGAIKELKKIRRYSPFFLNKKLDEIIEELERNEPIICGHCKQIQMQDDGVLWCRLYKIAKPWDGYCEKGELR